MLIEEVSAVHCQPGAVGSPVISVVEWKSEAEKVEELSEDEVIGMVAVMTSVVTASDCVEVSAAGSWLVLGEEISPAAVLIPKFVVPVWLYGAVVEKEPVVPNETLSVAPSVWAVEEDKGSVGLVNPVDPSVILLSLLDKVDEVSVDSTVDVINVIKLAVVPSLWVVSVEKKPVVPNEVLSTAPSVWGEEEEDSDSAVLVDPVDSSVVLLSLLGEDEVLSSTVEFVVLPKAVLSPCPEGSVLAVPIDIDPVVGSNVDSIVSTVEPEVSILVSLVILPVVSEKKTTEKSYCCK